MKKVVVIGGGTGTFVTLTALKQLPLDLAAIVSVADSGGSTGRLRDEFGFLPVGDLRQALAAMASESRQQWIQKLLLYRFNKGSGLEGHNLGNLILTALQDMTGSTAKAIEVATNTFRLHGHIYPITTKNIELVVEYQDGTVEIGEHILDDTKHGGKRIKSLKTSPHASINPDARNAILSSQAIIIGPGDLYGSLLPNLIITGTKSALSASHAKIIYVGNLMTRYSQTHNLTAAGHVKIIEKYLGRPIDYIILNQQPIPKKLLSIYQQHHEYPVIDDLIDDSRVIREDLIATARVKQNTIDSVRRSYLRHNSDKLRECLLSLI